MIKIRIIVAIVFILFFKNSLFADIKILASIDDEIITNYDIKKEDNYLKILNPNLNQLTTNQRLVLAKNSIINQIVKEKEISKFVNIDKENKLIDNYLKNLYSKLGLNSEREFENILKKKNNYTLSEIKEKIKIELLWNELIYSRYINQVKIDKKEILSKVNSLQEDSNKEYFLSEIVFTKKKNITVQRLFEEIQLSIKEIGFNNTANITVILIVLNLEVN